MEILALSQTSSLDCYRALVSGLTLSFYFCADVSPVHLVPPVPSAPIVNDSVMITWLMKSAKAVHVRQELSVLVTLLGK